MALTKSANDSLREIFIQWVYWHTHSSHKQRDLQSRFGREKVIQRFQLQQIVKVLIVESFERDDEKAQYANIKHVFI